MIRFDDLTPVGLDHGSYAILNESVRIDAGPGTDAFTPPEGGAPVDRLPGLRLTALEVPSSISARVAPRFGATFDAGALMLRTDAGAWAKLAFERAPDGRTMAVSVVTRETSDDANGPAFDVPVLHLRVHLAERHYAFHVSTDGARWDLLRLFALPGRPSTLDFIAQSPTGEGCSAIFSDLHLVPGPIADLRDGT